MVLILIQERDRDEIPLHSLHFDGNHFQLPLPQLKFKKKNPCGAQGFQGGMSNPVLADRTVGTPNTVI